MFRFLNFTLLVIRPRLDAFCVLGIFFFLCCIWQPNYSHYIALNYLKEVATHNYVHVSENNAMSNTVGLHVHRRKQSVLPQQRSERVNATACAQAKMQVSSSISDQLSVTSIHDPHVMPWVLFAIFRKTRTSFPAV